jgi:hypothetical protein
MHWTERTNRRTAPPAFDVATAVMAFGLLLALLLTGPH